MAAVIFVPCAPALPRVPPAVRTGWPTTPSAHHLAGPARRPPLPSFGRQHRPYRHGPLATVRH